jgi:hypothetical protein
MSALTADIEAKGLKAYEQARAFERLRAWRLPVSYGVFVLVPVIFGFATLAIGHFAMGMAQFGAAVLFAIGAWFKWRQLKERYARNLEIVAELEKTYGDELPWVKVNNHFAELEKLKEELARERDQVTEGEIPR